jgi:peptidoglycan/xylan/chitin deacetylase (PgdA/CDA1 family)
MRIVIACSIVVLAVLAALGLAQTQYSFAPYLAGVWPTSPAQTASTHTTSTWTASAPVQPATPSQKADTTAVTGTVNVARDAATADLKVSADRPTVVAQVATPAKAPAATVATPMVPTSSMSQNATPAAAPPAATQVATPAPVPVAAAKPAVCPGNPDPLPMSRTVEIDTTGGPGFGFEHFKQHDFLKPGEVVLTFDDGPWQNNTPAVLAALAHHCVHATFFPIGKHATYYPEILKQVAAAGHSVGSHTWSHANLSKKSIEEAKIEIEMGISAVRMALGGAETAFFRFPALQHPPELVTYLGERNISIFSTDMDSFDFKMRKPDQVVKSVMEKLKKHGKGIVLMHDFQHATAEGIATLLDELKAGGYKVVHMRSRAPVQSLPQYDEMVMKEQKLPTVSGRPTADVVRTVN